MFKKIAFLIMILCVPVSSSSKLVKHNDKTVFDDVTGTTVMVDGKKHNMIITNLKYHFAIVLPYFDDYKIQIDEQNYILLVNGSKLNLSLEIFKNEGEDTKVYLNNLDNFYKSNKAKYGIETTKLSKYANDYILTTLADVSLIMKNNSFKGIKQVNYYTTKTYENERFKLHLSIISKDKMNLDDTAMFDYITKGFNVDFERK